MNVPEVMLAGLDFIIVEHRLHDKKKGTIRRITEIAEITGVLEGKTSTNTLFERDPVQDQINRTSFPSPYLATLQKYTGFTKKQIENEIREREELLKELVRKNIRSMPETTKIIQNYFQEKRFEK
jgi:flagellar protein FlaI